MGVCTCMSLSACAQCVRADMHVHSCACVLCVHISLDPMHKSLGIRLCVCMCVCTHVRAHIWMFVCVCVCACMFVCMVVVSVICLCLRGLCLADWRELLTDIHKVLPNCFSFCSFLKWTSSYCAWWLGASIESRFQHPISFVLAHLTSIVTVWL